MTGAFTQKLAYHWLRRALLLAFAAILIFLTVTAMRVVRAAGVDEARPAGAIIVFGAAEYAGRPSPVLRARLDHGFELFELGIAPLVITTGGAANDPKFTEGGVGRDYLISRGIPDLNLIAETQGDDTAASARRTGAILHANGIKDCVAVSDAYHMFRVGQMMRAQGIAVHLSPRPDSIPRTAWARCYMAYREAVSYLLWKLHVT